AGGSPWRRRGPSFAARPIRPCGRCALTVGRVFRPKSVMPIRLTRRTAASGGKRGDSLASRTGFRRCSRRVVRVIRQAGGRQVGWREGRASTVKLGVWCPTGTRSVLVTTHEALGERAL